jgi:hypothetical protein
VTLIVSSFKLRSRVQSFLCHAAELFDFAALHPTRQLRHKAVAETVTYIEGHMPKAISFYTSKQVLEYCARQLTQPGLVLEFGVFKGGTIRYLASQCPEREIHGFDSFEGLPEAWPESGFTKGAFSVQGQMPKVPGNVTLHKGAFDATLPEFVNNLKSPIALLHIDSDLYSSAKTIFGVLYGYLRPGLIIVFDDYFGFPRWRQGEHLAFMEFIQRSGFKYEYICHARYQVGVRLLPA